MPDFFVSYTSADRVWAEWIAFELEEAGFSTVIQAWDFRPGSNFVLEMQKAAGEADRTIMILSPDYLKSQFASSEWAAAFVQDPQGIKRKLVPIVVRECSPTGLLKGVVNIELTEIDESAARQRLLDGINAKRAKPRQRPGFPGVGTRHMHKPFPGASGSDDVSKPSLYVPTLKGTPTDADKRRFGRQAFDAIRAYFETGVKELVLRNHSVECDFQSSATTEFEVEIFLGGKSACRCRVWTGGMMARDGIAYAEGHSHHGKDSCNESLSIESDRGQLYLRSLFGGLSRFEETLNLERLNPEQAAEYLWRRFVAPLEQ